MSDDDFDTNIDNYTVEDLLDILNLNENYDEEQVNKVVNNVIDKFTEENKANEVKFFLEVQKKLLQRINVKVDEDKNNRDAERQYWFENEYAGNEPGVRDTKQKISVYADSSHPIMNRKYLEPRGEIGQDQLNPIYQNSYDRLIYIDSQYRNNIFPFDNNDPNSSTISTNFTIDLTERLKNTVSLELQSIYIPYEWNTYHESLGNTFFWVERLDDNLESFSNPDEHFVKIPNGNYYEGTRLNNPSDTYQTLGLCNAINRELNKFIFSDNENGNTRVGYHWPFIKSETQPANPSIPWKKDFGALEVGCLPSSFNNHVSKHIAFKNYSNLNLKITFYKRNSSEARRYCKNNFYANNNLGFMLGYRITPDEDGNVSMIIKKSTNNLAWQQNETDNLIGALSGNNNLPNVYTHLLSVNEDLNYCGTIGALGSSFETAVSTDYLNNWKFPGNISNHFFSYISSQSSVDIFGPKYLLLILDDFNHNRINSGAVAITSSSNKLSIPSYARSAPKECNPINQSSNTIRARNPRLLTQAQLYTANEILLNRSDEKERPTAPNNSNIFGIITLPLNIDEREYGISSFDIAFKRHYFGPVNIDRLKVSLLDDKGNILNLGGRDWFFSIKATELYQF